MALVDEAAVNRAIKIGACNIYHGCVHNMLHEKSEEILRALYKSATFVVQAIVFKETEKYIKHHTELISVAKPNEASVVNTFLNLKSGLEIEFFSMSDALLTFAKKWIAVSD